MGEKIGMVVLECKRSQDRKKKTMWKSDKIPNFPKKEKRKEKTKLLTQSLLLRCVMCALCVQQSAENSKWISVLAVYFSLFYRILNVLLWAIGFNEYVLILGIEYRT